jgi:hypothetical protein
MKIISVQESMFGKAQAIVTDEGVFGKKYKVKDIKSVIPISAESGRSMPGAAGGVVAGGLLLGPIGMIAGGLLGSGKSTVAVQVTLHNGRVFNAEIPTKKLVTLASSVQ